MRMNALDVLDYNEQDHDWNPNTMFFKDCAINDHAMRPAAPITESKASWRQCPQCQQQLLETGALLVETRSY